MGWRGGLSVHAKKESYGVVALSFYIYMLAVCSVVTYNGPGLAPVCRLEHAGASTVVLPAGVDQIWTLHNKASSKEGSKKKVSPKFVWVGRFLYTWRYHFICTHIHIYMYVDWRYHTERTLKLATRRRQECRPRRSQQRHHQFPTVQFFSNRQFSLVVATCRFAQAFEKR